MRCCRIAIVLLMALTLTSCQGKDKIEPTETPSITKTQTDKNSLFSDNYKTQSQLYADARMLVESYDAETLSKAFKYIDCEKEVKNTMFKYGVHTLSEGYLLDSYNIMLTGVSPIDSNRYKYLVHFTSTYTDEEETGYLDKAYLMIMHYNGYTLEKIELIQHN